MTHYLTCNQHSINRYTTPPSVPRRGGCSFLGLVFSDRSATTQMEDAAMTTTEERMETLEKQIKSMKGLVVRLFVLLVLTAGGLVASVLIQPDVIRAKGFEVVNDNDVVVVSVGESSAGIGLIATCDSRGIGLVQITATTSGQGVVTTLNEKGQQLVELGVTTDGGGTVRTKNGKGQSLVEIGVTVSGDGFVQTNNGKGESLVRLGVTTEGEGLVVTEDGKGQATSTLP